MASHLRKYDQLTCRLVCAADLTEILEFEIVNKLPICCSSKDVLHKSVELQSLSSFIFSSFCMTETILNIFNYVHLVFFQYYSTKPQMHRDAFEIELEKTLQDRMK
ncbi:hypothetical protein T4D_1385 [Trichinella pseudospiralis]|uniref:Uncharacterized protein n=1 Tax=Trichinella pseudospiralis TaxID=6337 RepID=A0A0V1FR33_TRIPS|nr:hypothetical protein T4D_1385 [Trichinella pseudospiralis]